MSLNLEHDPIKDREKELRKDIDFFISHLSLKELEIICSISHKFADSYSDTYAEWKLNIRKNFMEILK